MSTFVNCLLCFARIIISFLVSICSEPFRVRLPLTVLTSTSWYFCTAPTFAERFNTAEIRRSRIDDAEIDALLERAGILEIKDQYAGSLSSGERQKLSFLRAIVFRPKLILMDETLSNLDAESAGLFREMIIERHREDGSTWLIVSHQWDAMNELFDEVHHMEKGRIVKNETP